MSDETEGRSNVILIVEDEPLIRLLAVDIATDAGFIVLEASEGEEAIAILETHPEITLVFTDIDMPGSLDGLALALCVRDRWPPMAIIITSGKVRPASRELPTDAMFIPKPYRPSEMRTMLQNIAR